MTAECESLLLFLIDIASVPRRTYGFSCRAPEVDERGFAVETDHDVL